MPEATASTTKRRPLGWLKAMRAAGRCEYCGADQGIVSGRCLACRTTHAAAQEARRRAAGIPQAEKPQKCGSCGAIGHNKRTCQ